MDNLDRYIGCLLGGALGDALGYPIEFMDMDQIKLKYGTEGIQALQLDAKSGKALISDDTQMTLFTADGLIWSQLRCSERGIGSYEGSGVLQSYYRWCYTQTNEIHNPQWLHRQRHEMSGQVIKYEKTIMEYPELYARRAPGISCLSALSQTKMGTLTEPINDSKGCGGVMRVAPVGLLLHKEPPTAFLVGMKIAALTHGHPTGYLASGALAALIAELVNGKTIRAGLASVLELLRKYDSNHETTLALQTAIRLADSEVSAAPAILQLGEGWIAEEALAIAVYCALKAGDAKKALQIAVNHDGDSDSTGAICGNILGASSGVGGLPQAWLLQVELKELVIDLAEKLFQVKEEVTLWNN